MSHFCPSLDRPRIPRLFHSQENEGFVGVVPTVPTATDDPMCVSGLGAGAGGLPRSENETALPRIGLKKVDFESASSYPLRS
ncbi:hypothetical protein QUB05_02630 [Microcoleus sp. F10-C6]|uniref:hypothetical protein n=1 Tax=unclassified Microcoleus TaxID=2642155 RepID=UPI002FD08402